MNVHLRAQLNLLSRKFRSKILFILREKALVAMWQNAGLAIESSQFRFSILNAPRPIQHSVPPGTVNE